MSPATGKRYPLTLICSVWRVNRSSVYACRERTPEGASQSQVRKRGPKTPLSDAELVKEIRTVLKDSRFLGEGHKKVTIRLRHKGIRVGKNRVLRRMRENRLLAPVRQRHERGDRTHRGTVRTERPDEMWGTETAAASLPVRTRPGSGPRRTAGAGFSPQLTTARMRSWVIT